MPRDYDAEILAMKAELESLEKEKLEDESHPIPKRERDLAESIHELTCRYNHTDGCGFYYTKDWNDPARKYHLLAAQRILALVDGRIPDATILSILTIAHQR